MDPQRKGEFFIFSAALFWSFFPILTILSLSTIGPLFSLSVTAFFALIFFTLVIVYKRRWTDFKERAALKDALLASFFLGILFYSFFFIGLQFTTAGNASLIGLMTIFSSFLFFNVIRKEHITKKQVIGAVLMVVGALTVILPDLIGSLSLNKGDMFIFLAVFMGPIGNFFQQRARKKISGETILFIRTLITVPVVFVLALLLGETVQFSELGKSIWWIVLSGFLLLGLSKIWWIEGIHRISVTKAEALGAVTPLLTLFFAFLILKEIPNMYQLLSFIPLAFGVFFLTRDKMDSRHENLSVSDI